MGNNLLSLMGAISVVAPVPSSVEHTLLLSAAVGLIRRVESLHGTGPARSLATLRCWEAYPEQGMVYQTGTGPKVKVPSGGDLQAALFTSGAFRYQVCEYDTTKGTPFDGPASFRILGWMAEGLPVAEVEPQAVEVEEKGYTTAQEAHDPEPLVPHGAPMVPLGDAGVLGCSCPSCRAARNPDVQIVAFLPVSW